MEATIKVGDMVNTGRGVGRVVHIFDDKAWIEGDHITRLVLPLNRCQLLTESEFPRVRGQRGQLIQISGEIGDHTYVQAKDIPLLIKRLQAVL